MHLSRKHFREIAKLISEKPLAERRIEAEMLASTLASTNPRFDKRRFLEACKIEGE